MRKFFNLVFGFALLFLTTAPAFAALDYDLLYTVDSFGSTTPKATFNLDEQPWLYAKLPLATGLHADVSLWTDPFLNTYGTASFFGTNEVWTTLSDWSSVVTPGVWGISSAFVYPFPTPASGGGATRFTVTPEPISASLFLIGGGALAAFRVRKKIKK